MEYMPGGDLLSLMMIRNEPFSEDLVKFYLAEITVALHALHSLGYVHRDVKPENILLDRFGHLKLTDFGSAAKIGREGQVVGFKPVGTPDYIGKLNCAIRSGLIPYFNQFLFVSNLCSTGIVAANPFGEIQMHRVQ